MNTFLLSSAHSQYRSVDVAQIKRIFSDGCLVIGVKDQAYYDLDVFMKKYPQLEIVKRFPDTYNPNYLPDCAKSKTHILQPAILKWKDKK